MTGVTRYLVGRLLSTVVAFLALTLFVFIAFFAMPQRTFRRAPPPPAYRLHGSLVGAYTHYLWRVVAHADLGRSYGDREPVATRLFRAAPITLSLVAGGLVLWLLFFIPLGLLAALRPRSMLDRTTSVFVFAGFCAQPLWLGLLVSWFFGHYLGVLPAQGYCGIADISTGCDGLSHWAQHLILPWVVFAVVNGALFTTMVRALVIEELEADYVRTAEATGAGRLHIVRKHVMRNVTLPLLTMLGLTVATALAGVVFIETAFDLPGLGGLLRQSTLQRDVPMIAGSVLCLAFVVVVLNLVVDLAYAIVDPRIRAPAT
jgi:peptide/nickel transport system permease protein